MFQLYAWGVPSGEMRQLTHKPTGKIGGYLSPDGRHLVLLSGLHASLYTRQEDEPWSTALQRLPQRIALPVIKQAEAIAYSRDGKSLYLTSEGDQSPLWELKLREE